MKKQTKIGVIVALVVVLVGAVFIGQSEFMKGSLRDLFIKKAIQTPQITLPGDEEPGIGIAQGGNLTVYISDLSPNEQDVTMGETGVVYTCIDLITPSVLPVRIDSIDWHRYHTGDANDFEKVYMYEITGDSLDDYELIGNETTISRDDNFAKVDDLNLVIQLNTAKTVCVVADMSESGIYGNQNGFDISSDDVFESNANDILLLDEDNDETRGPIKGELVKIVP